MAYNGHEDLPADDREIYGRDALIGTVDTLVRDHRLVTLWGPGGVGKTRVAIRIASTVRRPFQDGVRFVDLRTAASEGDVLAAVLASFRAQTVATELMATTLVRALGATRVLVVLDNCEHVLDAVRGVISSILDHCPSAHLLTTSREPLSLWDERAVEVEPLPVPPADAGQRAAPNDAAVRLFIDRAEASRPGFAAAQPDMTRVIELCRAAAGLPLALELLGARVGVEGLDGAPADVIHRLVTAPMSQALTRTLSSLGEAPRSLFGALSIFQGSFDRRQATSLSPDVGDATTVLDHLVRTAMVQKAEGDRFRVLEPFRGVGLERLTPDLDARLRDDHAQMMLERAEAAGALLRTSEEAASVAQFSGDFADLRAAFQHFVERRQLEEAARLAIGAFQFCLFQPRPEGHAWVRLVASRTKGSDPWAAEIFGGAALASWYAGESSRAMELGLESVEIASSNGGSDRWARMALADAYGYVGDLDGAVPHYLEVVRASKDDEPFWQIHGRGFEAVGLAMVGLIDQAQRRVEGALRQAADLRNPDCTQWAFYALGRVLSLSDRQAACEAFETGMQASASVGSRFNVGVDLVEWVGLKTRDGRAGHGRAGHAGPARSPRRLGQSGSAVASVARGGSHPAGGRRHGGRGARDAGASGPASDAQAFTGRDRRRRLRATGLGSTSSDFLVDAPGARQGDDRARAAVHVSRTPQATVGQRCRRLIGRG